MRGRVRKDKDLEENINNRFPPGAGEGANGNAAVLGKPRHLRLIFKLLIGFGAGLVASGLLGGDAKKATFILAQVENARFRKPVTPGCKLVTVAKIMRLRKPLVTFELKGYVNGESACDCNVKCMLGEG